MRVRHIHGARTATGSFPPVLRDKNEMFILMTCTACMIRILNQYPLAGEGIIAVLKWILGSDMEKFRKGVLRYAGLKKSDLEKRDLEDCFEKMNRSELRECTDYAIDLLKKRMDDLRYSGRSDIEKQLDRLVKLFGLSKLERDLCLLLFINGSWEAPEKFMDEMNMTKMCGRKYLASILGATQKELNDLLGGRLAKIGMIEVDQYGISLSDIFISILFQSSSEELSTNFFRKVKNKTIPLKNHFIERARTEHVLKLLRSEAGTPTHILLYGAPGTGKTSYTYGLAQALGVPCYEVARDDENTSMKRRAAITACRNMVGPGKGALIVIDEADNLLNTMNSWQSRGETQDKGWLNQFLEEPGTRIVWITNDISEIEDSVLRRFAFSIHFEPFNREQRFQVWKSILSKHKTKIDLDDTEIDAFASRYRVSAGAVDLAVRKSLDTMPKRGNLSEFRKAVRLALDSHQELLRGGEKEIQRDKVEQNYSLDGLNVKGDLVTMLKHLAQFEKRLRESPDERRNMNLLFYGPPGTGKSELARYIAHSLKKEILCKTASDILDPYVGMTERNIREAFAEAERESAILIMDEADTLLFKRSQAQRSWEVSATNEFLTRMERFRGILICTTNRFTGIDSASIRRFHHKIGFDYLSPEGRIHFYRLFLEPLTNERYCPEMDEIGKIDLLAHGDFRTVRDRFSLYSKEEVTHEMLLGALREESRIKPVQKNAIRTIGF